MIIPTWWPSQIKTKCIRIDRSKHMEDISGDSSYQQQKNRTSLKFMILNNKCRYGARNGSADSILPTSRPLSCGLLFIQYVSVEFRWNQYTSPCIMSHLCRAKVQLSTLHTYDVWLCSTKRYFIVIIRAMRKNGETTTKMSAKYKKCSKWKKQLTLAGDRCTANDAYASG